MLFSSHYSSLEMLHQLWFKKDPHGSAVHSPLLALCFLQVLIGKTEGPVCLLYNEYGLKMDFQGLGKGSVGKALVTQTRGPEFRFAAFLSELDVMYL